MDILLAALLTCSQAQWIAEGAMDASSLTLEEKIDVVRQLMAATEPGCELSGQLRPTWESPWDDEST
jgi:nucleoside diphosphate kinase